MRLCPSASSLYSSLPRATPTWTSGRSHPGKEEHTPSSASNLCWALKYKLNQPGLQYGHAHLKVDNKHYFAHALNSFKNAKLGQ